MDWSNISGTKIGYVLGVAALIGILASAFFTPGPASLNILIVIAAGLIGWTVGILMTPATPGEQKKFSEYGKALATFVTGYVVGKLDKLVDPVLSNPESVTTALIAQSLLFVSMFLLGALGTFVWRSYVSGGKPK